MTMRCRNGNPHTHDTVEESRACWNQSLTERTKATRLEPTPRPTTTSVASTPASGSASYKSGEKILKFLPMVDQVPPGYYAVQADTEAPLFFMRVSRPSRSDSKMLGATVMQRVSGPDLERAAIIWPATQWNPGRRVTVYDSRIEDATLLLICDYQGAAFRYAKEIGKCARCNCRLTSEWRKVGIGPECVKHWPWMLEMHREREGT